MSKNLVNVVKLDHLLRWLDGQFARLLLFLVKVYKYTLSPWLGQQCRFYPTCSSYAMSALSMHGGARGFCLTIKRLARCHPFAEGGIDEVPLNSCTSECCQQRQHVGEV